LLEHGYCPPGSINDRIARSWQRSMRAGNKDSSGSNLRHALKYNHDPLAQSLPVVESHIAQYFTRRFIVRIQFLIA
jgi:hypothetical protein